MEGPRASVRAVRGLAAYSVLRQAADACQTLSINWFLAGSGSAALLGLAWIVSRLPWLLLPLAGAAADRVVRRRLVMAGDLLVAAAGLAVALARWRAAALPFLALYGLGYCAVRPATKGLSREFLPAPHLAARLSGLLTSLEYLALVVAELACGRWLLGRGLAVGLGCMAVLLAAGVAILGVAAPSPAGAPRRHAPALQTRGVLAQITAPPLRGPFILTVICGACGFAVLPLAPLLAQRLHGGPTLYALLLAGYSLGAAAGAALARWAEGWRVGVRGAGLMWLAAAPAVALAPRLPVPGAIGCFCLLGLASGFQDAGNAARVAALVPPAAQSQAMAMGSLIWRVPGVLAGAVVVLSAPLPPARLCLILAALLAVVAAGAAARPAARAEARPAC